MVKLYVLPTIVRNTSSERGAESDEVVWYLDWANAYRLRQFTRSQLLLRNLSIAVIGSGNVVSMSFLCQRIVSHLNDLETRHRVEQSQVDQPLAAPIKIQTAKHVFRVDDKQNAPL
jgi:hypothetical protein